MNNATSPAGAQGPLGAKVRLIWLATRAIASVALIAVSWVPVTLWWTYLDLVRAAKISSSFELCALIIGPFAIVGSLLLLAGGVRLMRSRPNDKGNRRRADD